MQAFKEFQSCNEAEFTTNLGTYNRWNLGSFDFLLYNFSKNKKV